MNLLVIGALLVLFIVFALFAYADFRLWRSIEEKRRASEPSKALQLTLRRVGQVALFDELAHTEGYTLRVLSEEGWSPTREEYKRIPTPVADWRGCLMRELGPGLYRVQLLSNGPPLLTQGSVTVRISEVTDDQPHTRDSRDVSQPPRA